MKRIFSIIIYLGGIAILGISVGIEKLIDIPSLLMVLVLSVVLTFSKKIQVDEKKEFIKALSKNSIIVGWIIAIIGIIGAINYAQGQSIAGSIAVSLVALFYGYIQSSILENMI